MEVRLSLLGGQIAARSLLRPPSPCCSPFSSGGQKFTVKVLAGFVSPAGRERRLRPRPLPPACRWLPLCFLFTRPSAVCAKSHTFLQHCHGQLTDAGTARPGVRSKPLIPLAAEIDEWKWVKSQPAGKASPGAGKVWVRRPRPLGIKTSTLWRSHGLFPRPLLT